MTESEEEKGFKVTDKRRVTLDDQGTDSPKAESPPKMGQDIQDIKEEEERPEGIDFSAFILSLGSSTLMFLGVVEDPTKGEKMVNLPQAREMIDLLTILKEKTKGNLNKEEGILLDNLLFDLRMRYVEKKEKSNKQG